MGVPALFRWLSKKYPKIVSPVIEELPTPVRNADGTITGEIPLDTRGKNPNGEEFDNLYLDMNGIVHPCSHPEDKPAPATEEDMMIAVFEYTERVVNMVRPRKLLYIAVDGVAPRAKMNQQRSRRFRTAQEAAEKDKAAAEFHADQVARGLAAERDGTDAAPKKTWDSNSITPGTPFMDLLAASLRYWISHKLSTDPSWANRKAIISDATVPGEGEHKIMNFIRSQRSSPDHDPNTRHVMYGLDADLIMLGIATHEPHFRVLREDVFANDTKPGHCRKCNQPGHMAAQCQGKPKPKPEDAGVEAPPKPFIWLHVGILREYLAIEMYVPNAGFQFDLERALDDWVFMCFFVGNDFLPHLPSLDIREDGIDTLIAIWRDSIPVMGGYVTKDGHMDLERTQMILQGLATQENAIFKRRRQAEVKREEREQRNKARDQKHSNKRARLSGGPTGFDETVIRRGARGGIIRGEAAPDMNALPTFEPGAAQTRSDPRYAAQLTYADIVGGKNNSNGAASNRSAAAALKDAMINKPTDGQKADLEALFASAGVGATDSTPVLGKRQRDLTDDAANEANTDPSTPGRNTPNREIADPLTRGSSGALGGTSQADEGGLPEDTVMLWEEGYQDRYYEQKFHTAPDDKEFRHQVARHYAEGLAWVLLYYFQGCASWTWYYPYHYAPFAEDFVDLAKEQISFSKGQPFRPYEQLMGVLPAVSNHAIPPAFHSLMTDADSPVIDFYPVEFAIDMNGKKMAWQGIALLPFIDEKRLLDAMATKYPLLTPEEHRRNEPGSETLLFGTSHPLYNEVIANFYGKKAGADLLKISTRSSQGLTGKVSKDESYAPNSELIFPFKSDSQSEFTNLDNDESIRLTYHMPTLKSTHKSMLLPGVKFLPPALDYNEVVQAQNRAERTGRSHGGVQLSRNGDRSDGQRINYASGQDRGSSGHRSGNSYGNNYGASDGYGRGDRHGGPPQDSNLANLPPRLAAQAAQHGFPPHGAPPMPPHLQGYPPGPGPAPHPPPPPPKPQGYGGGYGNQGRGYGSYGGGYGSGSNGYGGSNGYQNGRRGNNGRRY